MALNPVGLQTDDKTKSLKQHGKAEKELKVGEQGELHIPAEVLADLGITPGTTLLLSKNSDGLLLRRADPSLAKIYIEPTNACNLNCSTCARHSWKEPVGTMSMQTYRHLIRSLSKVPSLKKVSFWGLGEPLLHPNIVEMVSLAKQLGAETQIITNALLLDREMSVGLVTAGLDSIVISIDGTNSETNADIRSGADLNAIRKNISQLRDIRRFSPNHNPEIGIEFVIMKKNAGELRNIKCLASSLGASFIVLTNLLPYTEEQKDEILYWNSADISFPGRSEWSPEIFLPPIDLRPEIIESFISLLDYSGSINKQPRPKGSSAYCRFVGEGSAVVAWDGEVSPCIALMHSYQCFVLGREKQIQRYTLGNVGQEEITLIWQRQEYVSFRDIVNRFDFSPCIECGGCDLNETNEEDCFGNTFPVCGDCLWARGIIQCP